MLDDTFRALLAASLAAAVVWFAAAPAAAAGMPPRSIDWPHFRFDKKHTGYQPFETMLSEKTIPAAGLLWQADLAGELVFLSSPAVADGIVYIGEADGTLFAYDASGCNGGDFCTTPLWQSSYLAEIVDSPTVANGIVYVGSQTSYNDGSGKLNAFDAKGCGNSVCEPLWQGKAGKYTSYSSPTVWKDKVFMGSADGYLYVFDAAGCGRKLCDPLWAGRAGGGVESTAVVYKGTVFAGSDDGKLNAFKAAGCGRSICKPKWTGDTHGSVFQSSPAIAGGVIYIGSDHALSAFSADGCGSRTCTALWQAIDDNEFFSGSPAVANGRVYIPLESQINVYDAAGCRSGSCGAIATLFGSGAQDGIESSPTVANGVVYAGRNSGEVLAWPADCTGTCDEIWKGLADDPIVNSSPTVVNGKLYIGGSDHGFGGRLYVYGLAK